MYICASKKRMRVLKFGGTSVGKPERMEKVGRLVTGQPGKKIVVLSALAGTTNALVSIGQALLRGDRSKAELDISQLEAHYASFVDALYRSSSYKAVGHEVAGRYFSLIRLLAAGEFDDRSNRELLAQGELISTELLHHHLSESGTQSRLLPALHFMSVDAHGEPELEKVTARVKPIIESLSGFDILITQGYICRNHRNEIDNLKRGGSDYTASLLGAAVAADEIQIWTDIDGMHNNDPRVVEKTYPISELTFDEASELAYFGAKILHPSTIVPAQRFGVPVRLKNTLDETAPGTLISSRGTEGEFKAVAAKDGITVINIRSSRMLMAYGFLRQVFEVFERFQVPIDMITTSEVAVSLTIDSENRLDELVSDLSAFGTITVERDHTIISLVGSRAADRKGVLKRVGDCLGEVPVRMVSQGGSMNNLSLVVSSALKPAVLKLLNRGLFGL
jgi:aspartate kinase